MTSLRTKRRRHALPIDDPHRREKRPGAEPAAHGGHGQADREMTRNGALISTAGLRPTAEGVRVRLRGGKLSTTDGPFIETKEVIGGYAVFEAKSKAEAIELTKRFLRVHGDGWDLECEVRQLDGPEFGCQATR